MQSDEPTVLSESIQEEDSKFASSAGQGHEATIKPLLALSITELWVMFPCFVTNVGLSYETHQTLGVVSPKNLLLWWQRLQMKLRATTSRFRRNVSFSLKGLIGKTVSATSYTCAFPVNSERSKCSACFSLTPWHCNRAENILWAVIREAARESQSCTMRNQEYYLTLNL